MPNPKQQAQLICNQMLKGISGKFPTITNEKREEFHNRYLILAELFVPILPRASAAVGAVVCKCAIRYGLPKAVAFAVALKNGIFTGPNDPAKLFWQFLTRSTGMDAKDIYCKCVCAARAFCEDRTLTELRKVSSDIFDWDATFTYSNQNESGKKNADVSDKIASSETATQES